ncbi:MAG: acetate/propionate family kinase, partial [Streptococcaceae bacterium]|nr:acetate/propionate family kinase [Streptococcaceae bacterium]
MSKTIAINAGSSSLKWQLYIMPQETVIAKGIVERIGLNDSIFTIKYGEGVKEKFEVIEDIPTHSIAVEKLLNELTRLEIIKDFNEITGVGHRVVAGGEIFKESILITDEVMEQIDALSELAPLHNPANLAGIRAFKNILPDITSVAVFDTAFHTTMPAVAYRYPVPNRFYTDYAVRKYGAHGTSHMYVSQEAAKMLGKDIKDTKIITAHIGNGASITAVKGGESVDTSMGFTPLAGLMMGTRSGDIDPSLIPYMMEKDGITDVNDMINILN